MINDYLGEIRTCGGYLSTIKDKRRVREVSIDARGRTEDCADYSR